MLNIPQDMSEDYKLPFNEARVHCNAKEMLLFLNGRTDPIKFCYKLIRVLTHYDVISADGWNYYIKTIKITDTVIIRYMSKQYKLDLFQLHMTESVV